MEFELETSLGTIVVSENETGTGIWIDLKREDAEMEMGIAYVSLDTTKIKPDIIVDVYGYGNTKDHTHKILNKNIEKYFAD